MSTSDPLKAQNEKALIYCFNMFVKRVNYLVFESSVFVKIKNVHRVRQTSLVLNVKENC